MTDIGDTVNRCVIRMFREGRADGVIPFMSALLELTLKRTSLTARERLKFRRALGALRANRRRAVTLAYDAYIPDNDAAWLYYDAYSMAESAKRAIDKGVPEDQVRALIALHLT